LIKITINQKKEIKIIEPGKRAKRTLLKTMGCALTQIRVFQDAYDMKDDDILKALGGCSGGLLLKGSSCGVIFSGAMSLATVLDSKISNWEIEDELRLHALIKDYISWFDEKYGTTLCRERTGLNLWKSVMGLFRPRNLRKCLSHTGGAAEYLCSIKDSLPEIDPMQYNGISNSFHCARTVLEEVRNKTSVGSPFLERISVALDGGIGLQGGACGAISAAIMAISVDSGQNYMDYGMLKNIRSLLKSAKELRKNNPVDDKNVFTAGRRIIEKFLDKAGSLECSIISNTKFDNWKEFQQYGATCKECKELIAFSANEAINFITNSS